jgi:cytochrome c-type biogenesis protein CcmH
VRKRIQTGLLVFLILTMLQPALAVSAQEEQPTDDQVNAIAKKLYCPVCENTPLDVCGTQACIDWRAEIRLKLSEGWSEDQIIQYFVEQHGAQVLPEPPAKGFNLLVYILPVVIFLVGLLILGQAFRTWRKPAEEESAAQLPQVERDPYMNRMEEQIRKRQEDA